MNRYASGFLLLGFVITASICGFVASQSAYKTSETPSIQTLSDGKWQKGFEKQVSEHLHFYDSARLFMGDLNYGLFDEGRRGLIVGEKGWLFSDEELQVSRDDRKNYQRHLNFINKTYQVFRRSNTHVLIAIVPSKARVSNQYLKGHKLSPDKEMILSQFMQDLKVRNINFISLAPALGGNGYLKTDTHWSQTGAEASARMIARALRAYCDQCQTIFKNIRGNGSFYSGDLLKYLLVHHSERLKTDYIFQYKVESDATDQNLFDDQVPQIVLVGTSYSQRHEFNFENFLKEYMRSDVLNMAQAGRGPFVAMKEYLDEKTYDPKIIIWEIPERYLTMTD